MTKLSVNLNKIALLRNARGEGLPDLTTAARTCIGAGCDGITVHPRPDQRHVRPGDVRTLAALCRETGVEFNIEGNPFAPARGDYPGLLALCAEAKPDQVTLVPDGDGQLTSDHGFEPEQDAVELGPLVQSLHGSCARVSLFVDAGMTDVRTFAGIGVDRLELYTGPYAEQFVAESLSSSQALSDCVATAAAAGRSGLQVNAGHDLNQDNVGRLLDRIPQLAEVSIGHALIGDALYAGLEATVQAYVSIVATRRGAA